MPKHKIPKPLEKDVLKPILDLLTILKIEHMRCNAGGAWRLGRKGAPQLIRGAPEGWSDIIGMLPDGRFLAIEVKRPGEKPRPEQYEFLRRINASGGAGFWTDHSGVCHSYLCKLMKGWKIDIPEHGTPVLIPKE